MERFGLPLERLARDLERLIGESTTTTKLLLNTLATVLQSAIVLPECSKWIVETSSSLAT
jgi:hypothetical protein